jgi:hypothetical protein
MSLALTIRMKCWAQENPCAKSGRHTRLAQAIRATLMHDANASHLVNPILHIIWFANNVGSKKTTSEAFLLKDPA